MTRDPVYVWGMSRHHHDHGHRAVAAAPTFSLLRLSIWQRLAGAAIALGVLWLMVLQVLE